MANVPKLTENWEKTQLYQLCEDPVMKPFTEDLRSQLDEKWLSNHEKIGLSIDDLRHIASGELAGALVGTSAGRTAMMVLVDVTGNEATRRRKRSLRPTKTSQGKGQENPQDGLGGRS